MLTRKPVFCFFRLIFVFQTKRLDLFVRFDGEKVTVINLIILCDIFVLSIIIIILFWVKEITFVFPRFGERSCTENLYFSSLVFVFLGLLRNPEEQRKEEGDGKRGKKKYISLSILQW